MGKLNVVLHDDIDDKFRRAVFARIGLKKGNLTEALEEALNQWVDNAETKSNQ